MDVDIEDAREVIQWYQYQIAVKTMRALSGPRRNSRKIRNREFPKDSDGSAKVALIGIDRSIAAWRLMQLSLPERETSIVPLILQLEDASDYIETDVSGGASLYGRDLTRFLGEVRLTLCRGSERND